MHSSTPISPQLQPFRWVAMTLPSASPIIEPAFRKADLPSSLVDTGGYLPWLSIITALLLGLILVLFVCMIIIQQRRKAENIRFSALLGHQFTRIIELSPTRMLWLDYHILNDKLVPARMPERLDVYAARFVSEHVFRDDVAAMKALFALPSLLALQSKAASAQLDFRMLTPQGDVCWSRLYALGLPAKRAGAGTVLLSIHSIDEEKQTAHNAQRDMADALGNAQLLSQSKNDFMGRISHELRTPLNVIIGYLAIAKLNLQNDEKLSHCLEKADEASQNMLALVNNVLDISAIEKKCCHLDAQPFHLRTLLGNLGSVLFERARQNGVVFSIHLDEVIEEYLIGDAVRLQQVLTCLVDNGLKFTGKGGHVSLTLRQTALKADSVYFIFEITDNGIGLAEGYMQRIFASFYQEENTVSSRTYGGTGIGLPLAKNIVETMGGTIDVHSQLGNGSTFSICLPFGVYRATLPNDQVRKAYASLHVMLVDDQQNALAYSSLLLQRLGIPFSTAISGDEALRKAQAARDAGTPFQLYFVDWVMPGMNGHETARRLLSEVDAQAKIVVVTGFDRATIEQEASDLPIARFLVKPVFQSTVVDLLTELLSAQAFSQPQRIIDDVHFKGHHVLLAEDNELNREIAQAFLSQLGLTVDIAANGQEAFDAYIRNDPGTYQVVLMDIQMPVMDGYDATRAIRASAKKDAATLPIIAITANAFPEDIARSLAASMNDHLSKPIDLEKLRQMLSRYLIPQANAAQRGN